MLTIEENDQFKNMYFLEKCLVFTPTLIQHEFPSICPQTKYWTKQVVKLYPTDALSHHFPLLSPFHETTYKVYKSV